MSDKKPPTRIDPKEVAQALGASEILPVPKGQDPLSFFIARQKSNAQGSKPMRPPIDNETIQKRFVSVFYNLLRDHVRPADIEKILQDEARLLWDQTYDKEAERMKDDEVVYSNPYLEEYAKDIVGRIFGTQATKVKKPVSKPRKT